MRIFWVNFENFLFVFVPDHAETGRFMGCYKNAQNKEAKVEYKTELSRTNSNRRCMNICNERNYKYSGVQDK